MQPNYLGVYSPHPPQVCYLRLGTHLFVKVARSRDSEGTFSVFESSCHLLR